MTPAKALAEQAKALIYELGHRDIDWKCCISDDKAVDIIVKALAQRERDVWEEAAKELSQRYDGCEYHIMTELFIGWCRQKAQEVQGEEDET